MDAAGRSFGSVQSAEFAFDKVRVEVTKFRGLGGGLSEIGVFRHGRNIARHGRATASDFAGSGFDAGRINDGVTHSNRRDDGYWLLPNGQLGWIEIDMSEPAALLSGRAVDERKPARLVIWNTNNSRGGDRGTLECNIYLLSKKRPVWSQTGVKLPFFKKEERPLSFDLPRKKFDAVRVEVTNFHREGGGLNEIAVLRDGVNIARFARVTASADFSGTYSATKINDGITSSRTSSRFNGIGYWLLPSGQLGWIELDLSDASQRAE